MRIRAALITSLGLLLAVGLKGQSLTDFGFNASPLPPSRPVLLVLPSYPGMTLLGNSLQWHQLTFDSVTANSPPRFSVMGWAQENSNGRFTITPAGPLP